VSSIILSRFTQTHTQTHKTTCGKHLALTKSKKSKNNLHKQRREKY
jgi:hypothetical protein